MKNYKHIILYAAVLITAITAYGLLGHSNERKPSAEGFAVVELFTSEGCSSCPAADELAATIAAEKNRNVYILSYHVDYWNRLGWRDMFSSSAYSDRQRQYAGIFRLKSIYTPQVVVNGKTEFVGSDENKLCRTITEELKNTASSVIELRLGIADSKTVPVSYTSNTTIKSILNFALVQKHAETSVKKGENEGRLLKHVNIVRDLKKVTGDHDMAGKITLSIPPGSSPKDFNVIAFIQNMDNLKVTAAVEKDVQ